MRPIEFFFDLASPYSYLASTQIDAVGERIGRDVIWRPFLLGAVFKATSNQTPAMIPAKAAWMLGDLHGWANHYGVPFRFPPTFPPNSMHVQRTLAAFDLDRDQARLQRLARRLFEAHWGEGVDVFDEVGFHAAVDATPFDAAEIWRRASDQAVKDHLRGVTDEAIERGAFGAPTMFVDDVMYWGNDRLAVLASRHRV